MVIAISERKPFLEISCPDEYEGGGGWEGRGSEGVVVIAISDRNPFLEISCPEECEGGGGGVVRGLRGG